MTTGVKVIFMFYVSLSEVSQLSLEGCCHGVLAETFPFRGRAVQDDGWGTWVVQGPGAGYVDVRGGEAGRRRLGYFQGKGARNSKSLNIYEYLTGNLTTQLQNHASRPTYCRDRNTITSFSLTVFQVDTNYCSQ